MFVIRNLLNREEGKLIPKTKNNIVKNSMKPFTKTREKKKNLQLTRNLLSELPFPNKSIQSYKTNNELLHDAHSNKS